MGSLKQEEELEAMGVEEESKQEAILYVNGVRRLLPDGLAHLTLLEYLRDIGLPGTKLGCGEGGCGACTVMVSYFDHNLKKCMHYAVNACLAPLYSVEGMHVITVEGVGNRRHGLHPVQLRWSEVLRWIRHPDRRFLQTATKVWAHAMHVVGKTDIIGGGLVMAANRLFIPKRAL